MAHTRRTLSMFALFSCVAALALAQPNAHAQRYPQKPLRFIVPFPPGSAPDNVARIMAPQMTAISGQPVLIDSRPGAGGTLATDLGAKAAPDGHTLMFAVLGPVSIAPTLYSKLPYDPVKDFAAVTLIALTPQLLIVGPSSPFKSAKELIAAALAKPGELIYASAGNGTLPHLSAELFSKRADIRLIHVPYKGVAAALPDLIAGRANLAFANIGTGLPHVKAGTLSALAVTSARRAAALPDTPTLAAAAGLADFEMNDWFGVLVPARTPGRVVDDLHGIIVKTLNTPEVRTQFADLGVQPVTNKPAEFAAFIRSEITKWAEVIKLSGAKVE